MEADLYKKKQDLRAYIRQQKNQVSETEKLRLSQIIFQGLEEMDRFLKAKTLMLYWSLPDEVHTHEFILSWYKKKKILLPVMTGNNLNAVPFTGLEQLTDDNSFSVAEPTAEPLEELSAIDLILVPGMAFDRQNNRLGRGKGFYDRFLRDSTAFRMGICYGFQLLDELPVTEQDIKMDLVLTELPREKA